MGAVKNQAQQAAQTEFIEQALNLMQIDQASCYTVPDTATRALAQAVQLYKLLHNVQYK